MTRRLFLDLDGVLADFDAGVEAALGQGPAVAERVLGSREFWRRLARTPGFYARLPLMPDARLLFDSVAHLGPTILTGLPLGRWAAPQKVAWCERHFPAVPVITCLARDKHRFMDPGDVLVDDRDKHQAAYESEGVIFIHHRSAADSLARLQTYFAGIELPE